MHLCLISPFSLNTPGQRSISDVIPEQVGRGIPGKDIRSHTLLIHGLYKFNRGEGFGPATRTEMANYCSRSTPIDVSWLNQVEIYFAILQRKVLTPCDYISIEDLESSILGFEKYYKAAAKPFRWKFTR